MSKMSKLKLEDFTVEELRALNEESQQLIAKKQHQRLYDAYQQFEEIAEKCDSSIEEILQAGRELEKKRSIKYRDSSNASNTWTGRGRKPKWLTEALDNGAKLEDFAI